MIKTCGRAAARIGPRGLQLPSRVHSDGANSSSTAQGQQWRGTGNASSVSDVMGGWHSANDDLFSLIVDLIIQVVTFRKKKKMKFGGRKEGSV